MNNFCSYKNHSSARRTVALLAVAMFSIFNSASFVYASPNFGGGGEEASLDQSASAQEQLLIKIKRVENEGGEPTGATESEARTSDTGIGGAKKASLPYLNPIEGASGTLNNETFLKMLSQAPKTKVGLYNIVTRLTEPGIADGGDASVQQVQGLWGNTVAAESLFLNTLGTEAEGQDLGKARQNCITATLAAGQPINEALGTCSGGSRVVDSTAGALNVAATTGKAPSLREIDPNHAKYQESGMPPQEFPESPCQGDDEVCGTDYLFNQEIRALSSNALGSLSNGNVIDIPKVIQDLERARKEFLDFVGDIRFTSKIENGNVQTISSTIIPPRADGSVDTTIAKLQRARYEDFNSLMRLYCEWSRQICNGNFCTGGLSRDALIRAQYPTEVGDNNPQDVSAAIRDFWRDAKDAKVIRARLTTNSFLMHSKIVEDLYNLYKRDSSFANRPNEGGPDGACGGFYTGSGEPANYDALYGSAYGPHADIVNSNAAWHKPIYQMSNMIGEALYLDYLGQMGTKINNRLISSSGLTSRIRIEMLNLLNRAAIKRSKTGSVTIEEEMYTRAKQIQDAAMTMIVEPAKGSLNQATSMQQQSLNGAASQAGSGMGAISK